MLPKQKDTTKSPNPRQHSIGPAGPDITNSLENNTKMRKTRITRSGRHSLYRLVGHGHGGCDPLYGQNQKTIHTVGYPPSAGLRSRTIVRKRRRVDLIPWPPFLFPLEVECQVSRSNSFDAIISGCKVSSPRRPDRIHQLFIGPPR